MEPTPTQREIILAALPSAAVDPTRPGGVASLLVPHERGLLDAAVTLSDPLVVRLRPLPICDPDALEACMQLIARRRGQLSHEVSGPATGVLAALETVLEYEPIPDSSRGLLSDARTGMIRLSRLLEDRTGLLMQRPNMIEAPLCGLLQRWAGAAGEALDPRSNRLAVEVEAPADVVRMDAGLGEGVLAVLLDNAWRARRGAEVHVRISAGIEDGWLSVACGDDARGMDEQALQRAGELGFSTRSSGAGMGLFMVRWALRDRGGAVVLRSHPLGSEARVFLPLNNRPDRPEAPASNRSTNETPFRRSNTKRSVERTP